MSVKTLLAELEILPYDQRLRRMIALGKQAKTDPAASAVLDALANEGSFYARLLRLHACIGSGDGDFVLKTTQDPSRFLRGSAAKLVPLLCSDSQAAGALLAAGKNLRRTLLRGLLRRRRRVVIDMFLEMLAAQDNDELGRWLAYGSEGFVLTHLEQAVPRFGLHDWSRLARLHPDIACADLRKQAQAQTEPDPRLRTRVNAVLPNLAQSRPDAALTLVESLLRYEAPARLSLQKLAEQRPNEISETLLAHEDGGAASVDLSSVAHRLAENTLLAVLQHRPALLHRPEAWYRNAPATWLKRLSPDLRRSVFAVAGVGWRNSDGVIETSILAALPGDLRVEEARRHLLLPALATRPAQRLPYATFLPWDEANALLKPSIQNPNPDLRAAALTAQIGVARYDSDRLSHALALVLARANEQDPLRGAMLAALAALPPSRWELSHLGDLSRVLQDTLNAADLSPATASQAEKLLVSLVPFHPQWAAPSLEILSLFRGEIFFYNLGDRLTDSDVARLGPLLLPVFQSWETREREHYLVQAANSFGRRLRVFQGLVDILQRVLQTTRNAYVASQIVVLLARHRPDILATLVPALLKSDPTTITVPTVYEYLHRKRQDLLTPFLGQKVYNGRFHTGKTYFVLPLQRHFHRWTPNQQEIFAETLSGITSDGKRDLPARQRAVDQTAALPSISPERLIRLAELTAEPVALRDAALRALARLDSGQGIPVLMDSLNDARARIAIYALRSAILEMPAERALSLLQSVPTEKVTVAKEVVRLLGELKTPATYPVLLEMESRPLHRDVRVALLRALWDHLEQEDTWPALHRAADSPDPAVAAGVIRVPTDRLPPFAQQRLLGLIATLLAHPNAKVRLDTLCRCTDLPLPDGKRLLLTPLLTCLASPFPDETAAAARAVFATYAGNTAQDAVAIGAGIVQIKADRRVLLTTLQTLQSALTEQRSRLRATVRAVLDALADDPLTARHRAELAVAGLPWNAAASYLTRLADTNELHPEALMVAAATLEQSGSRDSKGDGGNSLEALETTFAASPNENLRRLALAALLAQSTTTSGWTAPMRKRLELYRSDPSPLVAAAAQFTLPPPEDGESEALTPVN